MPKSMAQQVIEFNQKILDIPQRKIIWHLNDADYQLAIKQLEEELTEYKYDSETGCLAGQADAMLDLIYFALGVLYKLGFNAVEIDGMFAVVHSANMVKVKGVKESRAVEGAVDAIKPANFVDPKIYIQETINARATRL